nr:hypothetical protein [Tanacetum cinerariifolium]
MTITLAQQVTLDNALLPLEKRVKIDKFKTCKKRFTIDMEVFREIFQIYLRFLTQEFDALPLDEEIVSFIKELSNKGDIKSITKEDFTFQLEYIDHKKQEKMYYLIFTKAIIHHFITKDKLLLMRNIMFMHIDKDDSILGPMRFVSKSKDFQTYLAYATGATSPKMKRKFKKPTSLLKKRTLVTVEEEEPEPAKKVNKAPVKAERSKGIELLSDVALLEEAQLKKALKRSKRETKINQAGGSSDGANFKRQVDRHKGDEGNVQDDEDIQDSNDEPQHADDQRTDSKNQETNDDDEETEDEFVHTPTNYVPTDDEMNDKSNDMLSLLTNEEKTVAGHVNVNQDGVADTKVIFMLDINVQHEVTRTSLLLTIHVSVIPKHDVLNQSEIVTTTPAPTISLLLSSIYHVLQQSTPIPTPTTTKATTLTTVFPDSKTLTALQLRVTGLEKDVKELKDVDNSRKFISTIKSEVPNAVKEYLGLNLDDALHKMEHARKRQVHKETITSSDTTTLEEFDQKNTLFETMTKSKSFNKSLKQRALYHDLMESIHKDEDAIHEGVADKLKNRKPDDANKDEGHSTGSGQGLKRQKKSKDIETSKKAKSIESSKGTSKSHPKSTGKSAQAKDTVFKVGDTQGPQNLREEIGNTDEPPVVDVDPKDWFKKPKRPPTLDPETDLQHSKGTCRSYVVLNYNMEECYKALTNQLDWNNPEGDRYPFDLSKPLPLVMSGNHQIILVDYFFNNDLAYLLGGSADRTYTTLLTKTKAAKYDLPRIEDMNRLFNLKGDVIVHLAAALCMFTRRIMIQKRVEDLQLSVESYQKKLNISRPMMHKAGITDLKPYYAYSNP